MCWCTYCHSASAEFFMSRKSRITFIYWRCFFKYVILFFSSVLRSYFLCILFFTCFLFLFPFFFLFLVSFYKSNGPSLGGIVTWSDKLPDFWTIFSMFVDNECCKVGPLIENKSDAYYISYIVSCYVWPLWGCLVVIELGFDESDMWI